MDNLATKGMGLVRALKGRSRPVALGRSAVSAGRALVRTLRDNRAAPKTSLNVPLGSSCRLAVMRMGLAVAKDVAHARGARINDLGQSRARGVPGGDTRFDPGEEEEGGGGGER